MAVKLKPPPAPPPVLTSEEALERFDPRIAAWFRARMGEPTDAQTRAWPSIARGENILLTAPTGSGKTLAAFLWVINRLATGAWPLDATHVLYVSPLKALNSDIQRNLLAPLGELETVFRQRGDAWPAIRVLTRSGDTPQTERRRQILRPPEIFITTPETLNLMLASKAGEAVFGHLKCVILDEIHAVAGSKRGTHLMTAVERLTELSGEFQRIALSATVEPPEPIARWVAGWRPVADDFERRPVSVLRAKMTRAYEVSIGAPVMTGPEEGQAIGGDFWWAALADRLKQVIAANRSTIIFVNNRRLCERIATLLNAGEEKPIAYSHHGSLSHETRRTIEQRLKDGELPAIVATASLELGIDIGALDQVVLLGTPPSVASALQRIGRSGHGVGQVSRALIFPTYPRDFVDAAVMAGAVERRDIEPLETVRAPLDLLAQWVVSMTGREKRGVDELERALRRTEAYRNLPRARLDDVLHMLSGEADGERMRAYNPLISWDRLEGTVRATKGALRSVYISGGTIPDRGYFAMRHEGSGAKIGELDEEFVWERRPGETFTFGAQAWTIRKITENDVLVKPGNPAEAMAPFWRAEDRSRDPHFSGLIGEWLEEAERRLEADETSKRRTGDDGPAGALETWIRQSGRIDAEAAGYLARLLRTQRRTTRSPLPHRHHVLAEFTPIHTGDPETLQLILHLPWGGRVNRPLGLLLAAIWEEREGVRPQTFAGNDGIAMHLPWAKSAAAMLKEIPAGRIEELLRMTLEGSGLFGAHFREAAARSLLLPRSDPGRRLPLWLSRVRAKKLFDAVGRHPDFPLRLEAWRSCLQDEFDLERLRDMLEEIRDGRIAVSEVEMPVPSPFAESIVWRETNALMYRGDESATGTSAVRPDLIEEVARTPGLRPKLARELVETFGRKLRRVYPEYAPAPGRELVDGVKQRLWVPEAEWSELLDAVARDHPEEAADGEGLETKLIWARRTGDGPAGVMARESAPRLNAAWASQGPDFEYATLEQSRLHCPPEGGWQPLDATGPSGGNTTEERLSEEALWLGNWLSFYGPIERSRIAPSLGFEESRVGAALEELIESGALIDGELSEGAGGPEVCDAENYERLLRISRRAARPSFEALPADQLPLFLAWRQGLTRRGRGPEGLQERLEPLLGLPMTAGLVEREILPARCEGYATGWLDTTFQESDLIWTGAAREKVVFCFEDQLDLLGLPPGGEDQSKESGRTKKSRGNADSDGDGRSVSFRELQTKWGGPASKTTAQLWDAVWSGRMAGETAIGLRRGILTGFKSPQASGTRARLPRRGASRQTRWQSSDPFPGPWRPLPPPATPTDAIDDLEQQKERVRLLLDRYGIVFRELLSRELPDLRWGAVFRTLRLMELGGEVLAGHFFQGLSGLQFIAPEALEALRWGLPQDAVLWMNAADPASICGLAIEGLSWRPPARRPTTHLVMEGSRPVMISRRSGCELRILLAADDPKLAEALQLFRDWLTRSFDPMTSIAIEKINGKTAPESEYLAVFKREFTVSAEPGRILLWRDYE